MTTQQGSSQGSQGSQAYNPGQQNENLSTDAKFAVLDGRLVDAVVAGRPGADELAQLLLAAQDLEADQPTQESQIGNIVDAISSIVTSLQKSSWAHQIMDQQGQQGQAYGAFNAPEQQRTQAVGAGGRN